MMDEELRARAIALHDDFTHIAHDRRAFMAEMTKLTGSVAAANLLASSITGNAAAEAIILEDDPRLARETIAWPVGGGRTMSGYRVRPGHGPAAASVMIVHENRGLTPHIRDVARRLALDGFVALAPDFLSAAGGTPSDEDRARRLIGGLDLGQATADGIATVEWLRRDRVAAAAPGKVGVVGFCWGGAMVNRLAVAGSPALGGGVSYYGPAPDPAEASKVETPLLLHLAGLDARVNATAEPWAAALKAAGKQVTAHVYPGVNHAFNNDSSAERYDAAAATLAWSRTVTFLKEHLTS